MDCTKKKQRQGAVIACMLLLTLMPFFLVKAFHVHGEHSCVSHNEQGHSRHDSPENCTICLFTLSPFIEAGIFIYDYIPTGRPVRYLISGETDVIVTLSRISSVHPLCVCHNSLEGFACHHCDCVQGLFMSRLNRL